MWRGCAGDRGSGSWERRKAAAKREIPYGLAQAIAAGVASTFGLKKKAAPQPAFNPQPKSHPKPMHRVIDDGKAVINSAYDEKILAAVETALKNRAKRVLVGEVR
ncbi:hypothetical protein [Polycladomyces subterraneus]|uniref:Uncharacterized protein n=1 Tax=Polycladomyces subterraneus TaxID=1016997 RepID=A0ABT8II16_9BACL|nr:hypothetical protein [Polycladomyces subterraneus]MDN4592369.1 hypothetical protein [Polycladomyces subterraneus]